MRKVTILIDTSELKESKTILFFTHKRVIRKEIMRKCLNQMFDFRLNEDEDILYFKFENEEDSFLFRLLKNFGYQLFAWFPEKYRYDAYFISSNYKYALKYKLFVSQRNNFELKLNEETIDFPIVSLKTKWKSEEKYCTQYHDDIEYKKDFQKYVLNLSVLMIPNVLITLWFSNDIYSLSFPGGIFWGISSVVHAYHCLSVSLKQFNMMKNATQPLSRFVKDGVAKNC